MQLITEQTCPQKLLKLQLYLLFQYYTTKHIIKSRELYTLNNLLSENPMTSQLRKERSPESFGRKKNVLPLECANTAQARLIKNTQIGKGSCLRKRKSTCRYNP